MVRASWGKRASESAVFYNKASPAITSPHTRKPHESNSWSQSPPNIITSKSHLLVSQWQFNFMHLGGNIKTILPLHSSLSPFGLDRPSFWEHLWPRPEQRKCCIPLATTRHSSVTYSRPMTLYEQLLKPYSFLLEVSMPIGSKPWATCGHPATLYNEKKVQRKGKKNLLLGTWTQPCLKLNTSRTLALGDNKFPLFWSPLQSNSYYL